MKRLIKRLLPTQLLKPLLPIYHYLRAVFANVICFFPARKLKVIGVTGTNGKTTVVRYLAEIYKASGLKVGYSTSVDTVIDDRVVSVEKTSSPSPTTTRDAFAMQKLMKKMKQAKVDVVVLEVTSHALAQYRTLGIPIDTAVLTNISPDHLDYHQTMKKYLAAKAKLFESAKRKAIINVDDEQADYFTQKTKADVLTFGESQNAKTKLTGYSDNGRSSSLKIKNDGIGISAKLNLIGKFNALNALAASAAAFSDDVQPNAIKQGLESLHGIPGRMEEIDTNKDFRMIIDYAHSPEAFKRVFSSVKESTKGRILAVFGGAAQHDFGGLGEEAGKQADVIIVTDDEPEGMDPEEIRKTIIKSATSNARGNLEIHEIPNRREGIKKAVTEAKTGDLILLLCLGHQSYRRVGDKKIQWSDREEAAKILEEVQQAGN